MCVNLHAPWQDRLAKIPNLDSHSRKHSQQDCLLKNRIGTALRISRAKLPARLRAQKSKRHRPPNLESQTPNRITCSKIEEASPSESRKSDSQQDYFLKNQRDTALRISRVRLLTGLLSQKSKRHRSPNLDSQTPNKITCSKIEEAPPSESREPDSKQDYFLKNRRDTALRISRVRFPTGLLSQKSKRHRYLNLESQIPDMIACSKTKEAFLSELRKPDFFG
ncbi:hypothetical protein ACFX13_006436 [Malus domestica]